VHTRAKTLNPAPNIIKAQALNALSIQKILKKINIKREQNEN
jgi:hypothetical protein